MDRVLFLLRLLIILLISLAAPGCGESTGRGVDVVEGRTSTVPQGEIEGSFKYARVRLGTTVRIQVHAMDRARAERAAMAAFDRIEALEAILSDYRDDSELAGLASASPGTPVPVSPDLLRVLARSRLLAAETGGAFDPTCGPVTRLWRESFRLQRLPGDDAVAKAAASVGWAFMHVDAGRSTVLFDLEGMQLDLGAFGKGWIADEALAVLASHGCPASLVEIGGDLSIGDPPPGQAGWPVGVALDASAPSRTVVLSNCGVATSGDAEQHLDVDGVRYSHLLDPRTGWALNVHRAVSVVACDAATADALASAVCVLGPIAGRSLLAGRPEARLLAVDMD